MRPPKTIQGYLNLLQKLADVQVSDLKNYDELDSELKLMLGSIVADIDNACHDLVFNSSVEDEFRIKTNRKPFNLTWRVDMEDMLNAGNLEHKPWGGIGVKKVDKATK